MLATWRTRTRALMAAATRTSRVVLPAAATATGRARAMAMDPIEALPVSREVETRYGYTKSVLFVRQDIFMGVRAVHWLKEGKKIKYQEMRGIKQIDGIWVSTEFRMKSTKNKVILHKTVMKWSNIQFNQPIDDHLFTVRRQEKGI